MNTTSKHFIFFIRIIADMYCIQDYMNVADCERKSGTKPLFKCVWWTAPSLTQCSWRTRMCTTHLQDVRILY
jgi:hypothetical protein